MKVQSMRLLCATKQTKPHDAAAVAAASAGAAAAAAAAVPFALSQRRRLHQHAMQLVAKAAGRQQSSK